MGERALAHIEKVVTTYPIEGADNIEMTQVLDFHVVTKKGEFKTGDLVVYIEVDSILPDGLPAAEQAQYDELKKLHKKATGEDIARLAACMAEVVEKNTRPEFEFLRGKKFRIKCIKMNAFKDGTGNPIFSQGIIFPLSIIPTDITPIEGQDLTEALGIVKVVEDAEDVATGESQVTAEKIGKVERWFDHRFKRYTWYRRVKKELKGEKISGKWESWMMPQSDQENIQKIFTKLKERWGDDDGWWVSSKVEGQSGSYYYKRTPYLFGLKNSEHFGVCTHHRHLPTDDGSQFWKTARELDFEKRLKAVGKNLMLQGEHSGGKIQGNIYKLPSHRIFLFDIWDIDEGRYYNFDEFFEFCHKYQFEHVPLVDAKFALKDTVQEMLNYSNGTDELVPGVVVKREGVVIRRRDNPLIHFKVKSPEYLALHGK